MSAVKWNELRKYDSFKEMMDDLEFIDSEESKKQASILVLANNMDTSTAMVLLETIFPDALKQFQIPGEASIGLSVIDIAELLEKTFFVDSTVKDLVKSVMVMDINRKFNDTNAAGRQKIADDLKKGIL